MSEQRPAADETFNRLTPRQILARVLPYVRRQPLMVAVCLVSVIGAAAASRALPWIIGRVVDQAVLPGNAEVFLNLALLYLVIELVKTVLQFSQSYSFQIFGNRMLTHVRTDLQKHVLALPVDYFNRTPAGRVVTRLTNDIGSLGELFSDGVIKVFTSTVVLLSTVVAMSLVSWKLTLVTIISAPFFIYITWRLTVRLRGLLHETKTKVSALNSFLAENISGLRVIQIYNRVDRQNERFAKLTLAERDAIRATVRGYAWMQPVLNLFNATVVTTALIAGGALSLEGGIALGALVTFILYAQDFIQPIRDILEKVQQFQNATTSAERVFHLLEEPTEVDPDREAGQDARSRVAPLRGAIEIRSLTFRYRTDREPALREISLEIPAGQSVAIVGRTGSGKTTLISLLQRFYQPPEGTVFLDGRPLEEFDKRGLRGRLGVIQQDPILFRGDVLENIRLENETISPAQAQLAAERVGLRLGLNHVVEERGQNLSMGERQLIAFARILVYDPDILILDEATSNVDPETEAKIQSATKTVMSGRTSLIIAHRLATVRDCARLIVMENGRIVEDGAPAELARADGPFARLQRADLDGEKS